eukprot:TRINITY_DN51552_c0_g1_i1.p1 TRINITY_DN51552_c0_g1~~TRINITY_DN51552_c0_g1_i1.p1  ORF type:complete len:137 (+),score=41.72 TRINITY_DN51552_c0_g1_i1:810-1220(+)
MTATKAVIGITGYMHDWREMTIWDDSGYIASVHFDIEHNVAKCYFAEEKATEDLKSVFEEAISKEMQLTTSGQQKGMQNAKGKRKSTKDNQKGKKGNSKGKRKNDEKEEHDDADMDDAEGAFVPGESTEAYYKCTI